jgi:hypothetical protein
MSDRLATALSELVEALREELQAEAEASSRAPDRLYSIPEVCEALGGISRSALYEGPIASGALRVVHVGRRVFISADAVREFVATAGRA